MQFVEQQFGDAQLLTDGERNPGGLFAVPQSGIHYLDHRQATKLSGAKNNAPDRPALLCSTVRRKAGQSVFLRLEPVNLGADAQQVIDIVVTVEQALLFIAVNFESRSLPRRANRKGLFVEIDLELRSRIGLDRRKDSREERLVDRMGNNPLFSALFRKISAKKLDTTTLKP